MVFCKKCGKENKIGKFCRFCGTELVKILFINKYKKIIIGTTIGLILLLIFSLFVLSANIAEDSFLGHMKRNTYLALNINFCGNSICKENEIGSCYEDCDWCGDGTCQENELYNCSKDCVWCGDGTCQAEEVGTCYQDCNWCGDGYCQDNESCDSCSKDCGECKAASYCGDGYCNTDECDSGCYKDCTYTECQNGICEKDKEETCANAPGDCKCSTDEVCNLYSGNCERVSCGDNVCDDGETSLTCPNDCKESYIPVTLNPDEDYPIIFVHGHSPNEKDYANSEGLSDLANFVELGKKLDQDGLCDYKGFVLPSYSTDRMQNGIWGSTSACILTTYYLNTYDEYGARIGSDDNQEINTYAERLSKVVDAVRAYTGKNKVNIIAHSMGGLVVRAYIKNEGGEEYVNKLIMIGTPNHGTFGDISRFCPIHPGLECNDMDHDSTFINDLNADDETYGNISYYTIIGINQKQGDCPKGGYWDNVICADSVYLDGAENYFYTDFSDDYYTYNPLKEPTSYTLHTDMVYPSRHPDVYAKIVEFLKE